MKQFIGCVIAVFLCCVQLSAQIVIYNTSFPFGVPGSDSLMVTTYNSAIPALAPAVGAMWDLSTVEDSTPVFFQYRIPEPVYTFADSDQFNLFGFGYQGNVKQSIVVDSFSASGILTRGGRYSLSILTSGFTDSLFIDSQDVIYAHPRTIIKFPATYDSAWSCTYNHDLIYHLSMAAYSYDHTPGYVRTYAQETDSVTGYGMLRIKDYGGSPSAYFNVLQTRIRTITTDSIFLAGAPMSPLLLLPLGVTQGKTDTVYEECYYRLREVSPLARIQYKDAAYTQPYKCTTHVQRLTPTGIIEIRSEKKVSVYPNPAGANTFFIDIPENDGVWSYELLDITGRQVYKGVLRGNSETRSVLLSDEIRSGIYLLKVAQNDKVISVNKLQVIK